MCYLQLLSHQHSMFRFELIMKQLDHVIYLTPLPITVPTACLSGLAFNSWTSATKPIISNKSSIPSPLNAESGTKLFHRPNLQGIKPYSVNSCITRSGFAVGLSILFTATIVGTLASFAWLIASIVCGITPSSAATTKIVMSVT